MVGIATLAVTLIGMLGPKLNNIIFSSVIENGDMRLFLAVTVMLTATGVAGLLIGTVKNIVVDQLQTKTGSTVQAASMMRVLSLPVEFFKEYSAGESKASTV